MPVTQEFLTTFHALPRGLSQGFYEGRKYSVTVKYNANDRSAWLYGEELDGSNHISCNIYFLKNKNTRLKPCEMPARKVIDFVRSFEPV